MGVGSFGGFNSGAAFMVTSGYGRTRYGGGSSGNSGGGSNFSWIWFIINCVLFSAFVFLLFFMNFDTSNYSRRGTLISKYHTQHLYKGQYYQDYYFSVKWNDIDKETETFDVCDTTFRNHKVGDSVYFRRIKPEYKWLKEGSGFFLIMGIATIWIISGTIALLRGD